MTYAVEQCSVDLKARKSSHQEINSAILITPVWRSQVSGWLEPLFSGWSEPLLRFSEPASVLRRESLLT